MSESEILNAVEVYLLYDEETKEYIVYTLAERAGAEANDVYFGITADTFEEFLQEFGTCLKELTEPGQAYALAIIYDEAMPIPEYIGNLLTSAQAIEIKVG